MQEMLRFETQYLYITRYIDTYTYTLTIGPTERVLRSTELRFGALIS